MVCLKVSLKTQNNTCHLTENVLARFKREDDDSDDEEEEAGEKPKKKKRRGKGRSDDSVYGPQPGGHGFRRPNGNPEYDNLRKRTKLQNSEDHRHGLGAISLFF